MATCSDKVLNSKLVHISKDLFVSKTYSLLESERNAEIEETRVLHENVSLKELERRGVALLKVVVSSRSGGLYGRTVVAFTHRPHLSVLPSHTITPGDIVGVQLSSDNSNQQSGVVCKCGASIIGVAFDDSVDTDTISDESLYNITKLANDVTYKRLKRTLDTLGHHNPSPASDLIQTLFGESSLKSPSPQQEVKFFNNNLDKSQKAAVDFALRSRDVAIIHGPPGTGKTTTVTEIVRQSVARKLKLLVCAPSNVAVDNLVERLVTHKISLVRLGHPARVLPHIQRYSLDAIVANSEECQLVADVKKDIDKALNSLHNTRIKGNKFAIKSELSTLRKEMRQRETSAIQQVLARADVILATLTSSDGRGPMKYVGHVDLVVIDECSQAMEVASWVALLHGPRCVLVGDHLQLPPTVLSVEAAKDGLSLTLMERLLGLYGDSIMMMLTTQYRMHGDIMAWASAELYGGRLVAHDSVKGHLLRDLEGITDNEDTSIPLLLIDTSDCDLHEQDLEDEISKGNEGEADVVTTHVERLVSSGLSPRVIAVISPYNLQVENLRTRLSTKYPSLEIKSVDGFQGREKEAVVISMVRSNHRGEVGFLADHRRINVAVTRARRHLAVVCDSQCVRHDKFLASLVDYMSKNGDVRTALDYISDDTERTFVKPGRLSPKKSVGDVSDQTFKHTEQSRKPRQPKSAQHLEEARKQREIREKELCVIVESLVADSSRTELICDPAYSARDRAILHEIADKLGLSHLSQGEGIERRLVLGKRQSHEHREVGGTHLQIDQTTEQIQTGQPLTDKQLLKPDTDEQICDSEQLGITHKHNNKQISDKEETKQDKQQIYNSKQLDNKHIAVQNIHTDKQEINCDKQISDRNLSQTDILTAVCDQSENNLINKVDVQTLNDDSSVDKKQDTRSSVDIKWNIGNNITQESHNIQTTNVQSDIESSLNTVDCQSEDFITTSNDINVPAINANKQQASSKPKKNKSANQSINKETATSNAQTNRNKTITTVKATPEEKNKLNEVKCSNCGKNIPRDNINIHELHCHRKNTKTKVNKKLNDAQTMRSDIGKTRQSEAISKIDGDDFDSLINAAMETNKKCGFKKCKESVVLMGQMCQFCGGTYCLGHHLAEVHGCGEDVRKWSRQTMVRDGVLTQQPSRTDATKRAALHRNMDKKITEMAAQRKGKHKK